VLIGGLAARLLGSPTVTDDLDICHALDRASLGRLAQVLNTMNAVLRGAEDVQIQIDAGFLASADTSTLSTDFGQLDCLAVPAGVDGFEQLSRNAAKVDLGGIEIMVASLTDLMVMKRTAEHPKDLIELDILGALEEEIGKEPV